MVIVYGLEDRVAGRVAHQFKGVLFWPRKQSLRLLQGVELVVLMVRYIKHGEEEHIKTLYPRERVRKCRGCVSGLRRELAGVLV